MPLPDYAKKSIDTFTGKIGQDHLLLRELMDCASYQKLLTHKQDMSQSESVGARVTEDKAATKERTEVAQAAAEAVQKYVKGNAPVDIKEPTAHEVYERAIQEVVDAEVKDLWALGLERGYVGLTYDAQEEKKLN